MATMKWVSTTLAATVPAVVAAVLIAATTTGTPPHTAPSHDSAAVALAAVTAAPRTATPTLIRGQLTSFKQQRDSWHALPAREVAALGRTFASAAGASKSGVQFQPESVQGWQVSSKARILIYHPTQGQQVADQSSLTAFFDPAGKVTATVEIDLQQLTTTSGQMEMWLNGKLSADRVVTNAGAVTNTHTTLAQRAGLRAGSDIALVSSVTKAALTSPAVSSKYKKGDWWGNLNQCLSSEGVAAWVVAAISVACSVICIATVGVGCIACIAAAAGGTGGAIGYCITRANQVS